MIDRIEQQAAAWFPRSGTSSGRCNACAVQPHEVAVARDPMTAQ